MQGVQDQIGSIAVAADKRIDPARAMQHFRRISTKIDALVDKVVPT